ncbi:MAG: Lrp/AsnC family transcriptional regulator [Burkholderiaceae bacterium]
MDTIDRKLLEMLQLNCDTPIAELAATVQLSTTPCWRRVQRMKEAGIITAHVALVDPKSVNVGVTVFVNVKTNQHAQAWFDQFNATVESIPEVVEFYRMSGDIDYLLRIVVPDIAAYDGVYKRLIAGTQLFDVSSSFAMEQLKFTTALPLRYAD